MALRLTGLTNLLYEVASASNHVSSLWPVYSRSSLLEPTAESAWLIHTISFSVFGNRGRPQLAGLVFCRQASREFRQISEDPSGALVRCNSPEVSHRSSARRSRLEIAPVFSTAIMSSSAAHCGHQARREIRPCSINKELVSMVIVVCFAIGLPSAGLRDRSKNRLPEWPGKCPSQDDWNFLEFLGIS